MNCTKCNNSLIVDLSFKKKYLVFNYKIYNSFCLNCGFELIKEIRICKQDFLNSLQDRTLKAKNTKILTTEKTYNQKYQNLNPITLLKNEVER